MLINATTIEKPYQHEEMHRFLRRHALELRLLGHHIQRHQGSVALPQAQELRGAGGRLLRAEHAVQGRERRCELTQRHVHLAQQHGALDVVGVVVSAGVQPVDGFQVVVL